MITATLTERRTKIHEDARAILDKADQEKRKLTDIEKLRWDSLMKESDGLKADADDLRTQSRGRVADSERPSEGRGMTIEKADAARSKYYTRDGTPVAVLSRGESFRSAISHTPNEEGLDVDSLGKICRGLITNNWDGAAAEKRVMSGTVGTTGGFALMPTLSAQIIDLARNQARVFQAGARTVIMPTPEMTFARIASDPTAYWRGEGSAITASEGTAGALNMRARALACLVPITVELAEDSTNLGAALMNAITMAISNGVDLAALRGSGVGEEPEGLRYLSTTYGMNEKDVSSASLAFDNLSQLIQLPKEDNIEPNGIIMSPACEGYLDRLKTGTGEYLPGPKMYLDQPKYITNQIPSNLGSGTNETEVYCGDWSQLMIGIRTNITIEILNSGTVGTTNAVSQMLRWIRAYIRCDVLPERFAAFARLIGAKLG